MKMFAPMPVTEKTSLALRRLSCCAMFTVLIIHSKSYLNIPRVAHWNFLFQKCFCDIWTIWAVPFFFLVSGFFFVSALHRDYVSVIKTKINTLFIPYLVWAVIGAGVQILSSLAVNYYMHRALFANTIMQYHSLWGVLNALWGITSYDMIGNGLVGPLGDRPLWYVRTLFIIFLFSPLLKIFYVRLKIFLAFLSFLGVVICPDWSFPIICVKLHAIGYFCFGMLLREFIARISVNKILILVDSVVVLLILLLSLCGHSHLICQRILPLIIIHLLWCVVFRIPPCRSFPAIEYSFWVYCFHSLVIGNIIVIFFLLFGKNNFVSAVATLCAPVITLWMCILIGRWLKKFHPLLYNILAGGR